LDIQKVYGKNADTVFTTITVYNERLTLRSGLIGWLILATTELRIRKFGF